jgi:hypothetical protein
MKSHTLYYNPRNHDILTLTLLRQNIRFGVGCDGTGFSFTIKKKVLREMIK